MAAASRSLPYICPRCAKLRATRQLSPVPLREQRRSNHNKANAQEEARSFTREPLITRNGDKTHGWVARLNSSSLGKATSVLVLNSSQKSRPRHGLDSKQQSSQADKDEDTTSAESSARLMDLMNKYSKTPGQDEVNASIDALRPTDSLSYSNRLEVPRERFEHLLDTLLRQYNQDQLSRYVTIRGAEQTRDGVDEANQQKNSANENIEYTEWMPDPESKRNTKDRLAKANMTRKRGLAKTLLCDIWHLDVAEENSQSGSLALRLPEGIANLMIHNQSEGSLLSKISARRNVRIEASSGVFRVNGTRPASMKAVHDIEIAVQDAEDTSFDLTPFLNDAHCAIKANDISALKQIALRYGGNLIGSARSPATLRILALDQSSSQKCKRILMEHLLSTDITRPLIIDGVASEAATTEAQQSFPMPGRDMKANKLARGDVPTLLRPEHPVLDGNVLDDIVGRLNSHSTLANATPDESAPVAELDGTAQQQDITWAPESSKNYRAEMGQLGVESVSQRDTSGQRFMNMMPGLSQFFSRHLEDVTPTTESHIVAELVPSPWDNNGISVSDLLEFPRLELRLSTKGSGLVVESLKAQRVEDKEVVVRLPSTVCDIKILQRESLEMREDKRSSVLKEQLQVMRSSLTDLDDLDQFQPLTVASTTGSGLRRGHIDWNDDLMVDIPLSCLPSEVAVAVRDSSTSVENDAAHMRYTLLHSTLTEQVSVLYEGFKLQFESLDRGETQLPESILSLTVDMATSLAQDEVEQRQRQLLVAADKLCCELSRSIGQLKLSPAIARAYEG